MPTYTYRCHNCGFRFDAQQGFDDPPPTKCPDCGQPALTKVFVPVGIVFKGSGFYATDHRSPSGASSAKKDDRGNGQGEASTEKVESDKAAASEE
jgi:putative FmdB family regulatory protein